MKVQVYGEGGFDESKPNNNIVEEYEVPDPPPAGSDVPVDQALVAQNKQAITKYEAELQAQVQEDAPA